MANFDTAVMYRLSPAPSPTSSYASSPSPTVEGKLLSDNEYPTAFPSSAALAAMPIPPSRSSSRNKSPDHPAHHSASSRIAGITFQTRTSRSGRIKAAAEKAQHAERYPNYRFSPVSRTNKPVKRKPAKNGKELRRARSKKST
ncbi:hypothetical protein BU15DRAFT_71855 [Melanogaster broomeanus]|nr:hypothetical protein BU15DRAFT_71855 [Melanogaster broomeanus]